MAEPSVQGCIYSVFRREIPVRAFPEPIFSKTPEFVLGFFYGAPGMARSALTALFRCRWCWPDDLGVQVPYGPGKGNH